MYKVIIVENTFLREKLKAVSWGQNQVTEASHLVVFCNFTNVKTKHVDDFLYMTAKSQGIEVKNLIEFGNFIKGKIKEMTTSELFNWTSRQTYLALGNLLSACAELKIDSCPMEGFESERYNDILGLTEQGLNAAVIAAIGYRSYKDLSQNRPKVRKPLNELFEVL